MRGCRPRPRGRPSALGGAPVLRRAVRHDRVQRRALLADAAPRGDEVGVAALVREGVGRAPGRRAPAEHVLPPLPLLLRLQPLAVLLNLRGSGRHGLRLRSGRLWRCGSAMAGTGHRRDASHTCPVRGEPHRPPQRWGNAQLYVRLPGSGAGKWGAGTAAHRS